MAQPTTCENLPSEHSLHSFGHHRSLVHTTITHFARAAPHQQLNGPLAGQTPRIRQPVMDISLEVCILLSQHNILNRMVVIHSSSPLKKSGISTSPLLLLRIFHLLEAMITITKVVPPLTAIHQTHCQDQFLLQHLLPLTITTVSLKLLMVTDIQHPTCSLHFNRTMGKVTVNPNMTANHHLSRCMVNSPPALKLECMDNNLLHPMENLHMLLLMMPNPHTDNLGGHSPEIRCIKALRQVNIHRAHRHSRHIHTAQVLQHSRHLLMARHMDPLLHLRMPTHSNLYPVILHKATADKRHLHTLNQFPSLAGTFSTLHLRRVMLIRLQLSRPMPIMGIREGHPMLDTLEMFRAPDMLLRSLLPASQSIPNLRPIHRAITISRCRLNLFMPALLPRQPVMLITLLRSQVIAVSMTHLRCMGSINVLLVSFRVQTRNLSL